VLGFFQSGLPVAQTEVVVRATRNFEGLGVLVGGAERREGEVGLGRFFAKLGLEVRTPNVELVVFGQSYTVFNSAIDS